MNTTVISGRLVRNPGYNEVENEKGLHKIAKFVLADDVQVPAVSHMPLLP